MNQTGFSKIILILIIVILIGAAYWYWGDEIKLALQTWDWKTYHNDEFGFEFKYPNNFDVNEKSTTLVKLNDSKTKQIVELEITPFTKSDSVVGLGLGELDFCFPEEDSSVKFINDYGVEIEKTIGHYYDEPPDCRKQLNRYVSFSFESSEALFYFSSGDTDRNNGKDDIEFEKLADPILYTFRFIKR